MVVHTHTKQYLLTKLVYTYTRIVSLLRSIRFKTHIFLYVYDSKRKETYKNKWMSILKMWQTTTKIRINKSKKAPKNFLSIQLFVLTIFVYFFSNIQQICKMGKRLDFHIKRIESVIDRTFGCRKINIMFTSRATPPPHSALSIILSVPVCSHSDDGAILTTATAAENLTHWKSFTQSPSPALFTFYTPKISGLTRAKLYLKYN